MSTQESELKLMAEEHDVIVLPFVLQELQMVAYSLAVLLVKEQLHIVVIML